MARMTNRGLYDLTVQTDTIDITCEHDTLDSEWADQCPNGHDVSLRTAIHVIDESHWCNGDEGFARHDPHEHVDRSHYECSVCRVEVHPRVIPGGTPRYMPGLRRATIVGPRSTGEIITANLPGTGGWQAIAVDLLSADAEAQQRFLDSIPDEWVMSSMFSR